MRVPATLTQIGVCIFTGDWKELGATSMKPEGLIAHSHSRHAEDPPWRLPLQPSTSIKHTILLLSYWLVEMTMKVLHQPVVFHTVVSNNLLSHSMPNKCMSCCRQGSVIPFTPIQGPDAWYAKDYVQSDKYTYKLTTADIDELDTAIALAKASKKDIKVQLITQCNAALPSRVSYHCAHGIAGHNKKTAYVIFVAAGPHY